MATRLTLSLQKENMATRPTITLSLQNGREDGNKTYNYKENVIPYN